jgi:hypothetical protein
VKIPLKYNIGSLWVRWVGTLMTAVGIGLTVAIFITMQALVGGLDATFVETGQPHHLIVIQGSLNEVNSYFNRDLLNASRCCREFERMKQETSRRRLLVVINHPCVTGGLPTSSRHHCDGPAARPEMKWSRANGFNVACVKWSSANPCHAASKICGWANPSICRAATGRW